jgi:hypothetical protein
MAGSSPAMTLSEVALQWARSADAASEAAAEQTGPTTVMPGLVPGIHVLEPQRCRKAWMAGSSPAMTRRAFAPASIVVVAALKGLRVYLHRHARP